MAVGARIPRYALWLRFHEHGCNPEQLTAKMAAAFCDGPLAGFLAEHQLRITPRAQRRLRRSVERFDPEARPPEDHLPALE